MVVVDVWGLPCERAADTVSDLYDLFVGHLSAGCSAHRGTLQWLVGDRAIVTFNAAVPNTSYRRSAGEFVAHLHADWGGALACQDLRLCSAAVARELYHAVWGRHRVLLGPAVDACSAMLGLGHEMRVRRAVLVDGMGQGSSRMAVHRRRELIRAKPMGRSVLKGGGLGPKSLCTNSGPTRFSQR